MSRPNPRAVLSHIQRLAGLPALENCPDRELLDFYRQRNDETAFAVLEPIRITPGAMKKRSVFCHFDSYSGLFG
jgi:hypothetical protein